MSLFVLYEYRMSSLLRAYAENITPTLVTSSSGVTPHMWSISSLQGMAVVADPAVTNVGSLYTFPTVAGFSNFVTANYSHSTGLGYNETLRDMGNEVTFGTAGGENNLTFRQVQRTNGTVADGSMSAETGYVPIRNYVSQGNLDVHFRVKVSRQ